MKKDYFENFLDALFEASKDECTKSIDQSIASAAAQGTLFSGPQWKKMESIWANALEKIGNDIVAKFTSLDAEHSPLQTSDFYRAKNTIEEYRKFCQKSHMALHSRLSFPKSLQPFSTIDIQRIEKNIINEIERVALEFESKRSRLKRFLKVIENRLFLSVIGIATTLLVLVFEKIRTPIIDTIKSIF